MYGKLFDSMYDGTLYGQWQALVTFQQMIVLADADGTVDITPPAIAARTGIPIEIITKGIETLESPDPYSRTPGDDGRRIIRLDDHRPWGWHIVNYMKYKHIQDSDTVREQTRERVRRHRAKRKAEAEGSNGTKRSVTVGNGQKRHIDIDIDIDKEEKKEGGQKRKRFVPPTLDEVSAYAAERSSPVSPHRFMAHYESVGWKVGKNPMKDWRAAFRGWEVRERQDAPQAKDFARGAI